MSTKKDRGERIDSEVRTPSILARSLFWFRRLGRISAAVRARFALVDRQLGQFGKGHGGGNDVDLDKQPFGGNQPKNAPINPETLMDTALGEKDLEATFNEPSGMTHVCRNVTPLEQRLSSEDHLYSAVENVCTP